MLGGVYFRFEFDELPFCWLEEEPFFAVGGAFDEPEFKRLVGGMAGTVLRGAGAVS